MPGGRHGRPRIDDDDLRALVAAAHALDMRVLIELPLEGCAADARLAGEHPDWFCTDADGQAMPISAQPDLLAFSAMNHELERILERFVVGR